MRKPWIKKLSGIWLIIVTYSLNISLTYLYLVESACDLVPLCPRHQMSLIPCVSKNKNNSAVWRSLCNFYPKWRLVKANQLVKLWQTAIFRHLFIFLIDVWWNVLLQKWKKRPLIWSCEKVCWVRTCFNCLGKIKAKVTFSGVYDNAVV